MNEPTLNCGDCANSYDGVDGNLRCRIHHAGLKCSPAAYESCTKFEREPGADSSESPWFKGAWHCDCQGRGD